MKATTAAPTPFLRKLWDMLSSPANAEYIRWDDTGRHFEVNALGGRFASELIPRHFSHNNFSSFQRQLNYFGFHKSGNSTLGVFYSHPLFCRDEPGAMLQIQRKTNHTAHRAAAAAGLAPSGGGTGSNILDGGFDLDGSGDGDGDGSSSSSSSSSSSFGSSVASRHRHSTLRPPPPGTRHSTRKRQRSAQYGDYVGELGGVGVGGLGRAAGVSPAPRAPRPGGQQQQQQLQRQTSDERWGDTLSALNVPAPVPVLGQLPLPPSKRPRLCVVPRASLERTATAAAAAAGGHRAPPSCSSSFAALAPLGPSNTRFCNDPGLLALSPVVTPHLATAGQKKHERPSWDTLASQAPPQPSTPAPVVLPHNITPEMIRKLTPKAMAVASSEDAAVPPASPAMIVARQGTVARFA
jgi:hypothetical protein